MFLYKTEQVQNAEVAVGAEFAGHCNTQVIGVLTPAFDDAGLYPVTQVHTPLVFCK